MNKFYNKSISKVIIIPTLFIIIFNCIFPTVSKADSGIGGQLFKPLMKAVQSIGDSILNVLQDVMMPGSPKAVVKRNMADLSADELTRLGSTLTSIASGLTKVPILGDALVFVDNGIVNGIEWVKSKFTGDEPEYDQLKEFYKVHVLPIILYSPATIFYNRVPALDVNFIKPGVGETTRVLLRRIPYKILVDDLNNQKLKHILILAKEKNVEVDEFDFKAYSCCGIIKNMKDV